ncbi:TM2 domain-containing protein [Sutcliffiella sp. NPDC057660]|uniref:TM2 domain-containing protein n=1 Tax=Sutcliffiella sp. NPDC057660 TaxID=3346199 RepID=UPI0036CB8108
MSNILEKQSLSAQQLALVQSEMDKKKKSKTLGYLLWWFTGTFAGHRFYVGDTGYAVCMLLFGIFTLFIWNFVDVFFIGRRMELKNDEIERNIIQKVKLYSNQPSAI